MPNRNPQSTYRNAAWLALLLALAAPVSLWAQAPPARGLRKTDLIRLLTSGRPTGNVALMVRRQCLGFAPSSRDRADLIAAGADTEVLAAIASCTGRSASVVARPTAALRVIVPPRLSAAAGSEVTVEVRLLRGTAAQSGVSLVLHGASAIPGGVAQDPGATTDARGVARFQVLAGSEAGVHTLEVQAVGFERLPRAAVRLTTTAAPPLLVDVIPGTVVIREGSRVAVLVRVLVRDALGTPVPGVALQLRGVTAPLQAMDTVSTDPSGRALFAILPGALRASGTLGVFTRGAQVASVEARYETAAIAEDRTQFIAGTPQRGNVHTTLRLPLVLEVRDTAGMPVTGYAVRFSGTNAQVNPAQTATDSAGIARVTVTLGDRTGPAVVAASVGRVTKTANYFATPGPAQTLVLELQGKAVDQLALASLAPVTLRAVARDAYGNEAVLSGLTASVSGAARLKNLMGAQAPPGTIVIEPRRTGSGAVTVNASGLTAQLPLAVTLPVVRSGWVYGARAGGAAFNYGFKSIPNVDGRPGLRGELILGRRIVPGVRVEAGLGLGVLRAQAGTASLAVGLMQGLLRGEYDLTHGNGAVPVVALGGGFYRVKSTDPKNMLYHTSVFWLIGAGVDYPLAPRVQGELRLERQQLYEANSKYVNGAVGAITLLEIGVRVHP
jgi:hypothetical protein